MPEVLQELLKSNRGTVTGRNFRKRELPSGVLEMRRVQAVTFRQEGAQSGGNRQKAAAYLRRLPPKDSAQLQKVRQKVPGRRIVQEAER